MEHGADRHARAAETRRGRGRPGLRSLPWRTRYRRRPAEPQSRAGQSGVAIYKQLHDYKSGSRVYEVMTGIAQGLDDQQIVDVAGHFAASLEARARSTTAEVVDEDIVRLVERGDLARSLPACNSCHGANAGGPMETPTPRIRTGGISRGNCAPSSGRQPAQRHLHADAKRRRQADRPRDRKS